MSRSLLFGSLLPSLVGSLPPIHVENGKFLDEQGSEVYFRGVNVVYKDVPWLPHSLTFHSNLSFVADDVDLLQSLGVNLIRLGVMWPGVNPDSPNKVADDYVEKVRSMIHLAESRGIYTVLDPHQDEMHPVFCGEGTPDFFVERALRQPEVTDFPVPVQATPFPVSPPGRKLCDEHISFDYIWTHDSAKAYQQLWEMGAEKGGFGLFWAAVAHSLAHENAVVMGEIWNEPFPGDVFGDAKNRDNKHADLNNLQPFYNNITRYIREVANVSQRTMAIAFEPSWPVGDQDIHPDSLLTATSGFSKLPEDNAVYAFHYYSAPCTTDLPAYLDERLADIKRLKAAPYASEFNLYAGDEKSRADMISTFNAFESRFISYTGWQYKSYSGSLPDGTCTGCGNSFFNDDGTANTWMMSSMGRPFAQRVQGKATRVDIGDEVFSLTFSLVATASPTVIVVPDIWTHKQNSFQVGVSDPSGIATQTHIIGRTIAPGVAYEGSAIVQVDIKAGKDGGAVIITINSL